jgi:hypothetical protein
MTYETPQQHPTRLWEGRRFGIEMETRSRRANGTDLTGSEINRALNAADLEHRVVGEGRNYYSDSSVSGRAWEVKYDSTCGLETVSPALSLDADGECDELRKGCDALMALQPKIDRTCGLHVHVDVSDFNWKELQKLLALWARYEPFFFSMVPQSRRGNTYCAPVRAETWADAYTADHDYYGSPVTSALTATTRSQFETACRNLGRYRTLRMNMWAMNGRVEFRMHSGTVSYTKIRQWLRLVLSLVGRVKTSSMGTTGRLARTIRPLSRPRGFGTTPTCSTCSAFSAKTATTFTRASPLGFRRVRRGLGGTHDPRND